MASRTAYSNLLKGSLKEFVADQLQKPPEDQNSVQEELALLRHRAASLVQLYSTAVESKNPEKMFAAAEAMKRELCVVVNTAKTAAQIQSAATGQMTLAAVEQIVGTIVEIIYDTLREESNGLQLAVRIEKKIAAGIDLTSDRGTVRLPSDELVGLMDLTVPPAVAEMEEPS